jgi:pilus assembly protein CpaB
MGLVAAVMARNWIQQNAAAVPAPTGKIVVAAVPLGFGTELTRDNLAEIPWGAGALPEGAFTTKDDLLKDGRRAVLAPLERNEPVLRGKITGAGQRASLSALLEEGYKAVTIRVDDVRGVAGFVLPGDHVDVVLIRNEKGDTYSDVLIQHVKVLAVDQLANERQEKATVARAVTLRVTTEQAQKILLAGDVGKLSLILRQAGEANAERARRVTEEDLGRPSTVPNRIAAAAPKPAAAQSDLTAVDVVRGATRSTYNVERSNRAVEPLRGRRPVW